MLLSSIRVRARLVAVVAGVGLTTLMVAGPAAAAVSVVAEGLDGPRGLDATRGAVYVAEAGRGGEQCGGDGPQRRCLGPTGAVTRIDRVTGEVTRTATGLPSYAAPGGGDAVGPADVSMDGRPALLLGLGGDPHAVRGAFGASAAGLGTILRLTRTGDVRSRLADVAAHEAREDPDGGGSDSNPRSVAGTGAVGEYVVADAGANALVLVCRTGVSTLAVLPSQMVPNPDGPGDVSSEAVPTSVVRAADGSYLIGQLTGFPFPVGGATVFRVPAEGGQPVPVATGFTTIVDLALGPDGSLYVLQHTTNGLLGDPGPSVLMRVEGDGTRVELAAGELAAATGLDVAPDGTVYVSDHGTTPGEGRVVAISPGLEPISSFGYRGRHLEILRDADGPVLRVDGACTVPRVAFEQTEAGWTSQLLPFDTYETPEALARALVDGDGVLFVLCDGAAA